MKPHRKIAVGYTVITLLVICIGSVYLNGWQKMGRLKAESTGLDSLRREIHNAYVRMTELSLLGETVMDWNLTDRKEYHSQRMELDSVLCAFKTIYPSQRIDSVRLLLANKEELLCRIQDLLENQEATNEKLARQVPAITQKSLQKSQQKKRGGFLSRFKKKTSETNHTAKMLDSLNRDVIAKQQEESRLLAEIVDNLTNRNHLLNQQLKELIQQMAEKVQADLSSREQEITSTQKYIFQLTSGLIGGIMLLLIISYILIYKDTKKINSFKSETKELINKLKLTVERNEELLAARRKMMLTITHELRTPLTVIGGYAELIPQETDASKQMRYIEAIRQASTRMLSLLNTLLNFFRLESGKEQENVAPFRLHDITETLETEFIPLVEEKNLTLKVESCEDAVVIGDKEHIILIGNNLLSNAVKFTDRGTITLKTVYSDNHFTLVVCDTGTGMDEKQQKQIFRAFERLPNAATQDGFGLGLSIVQSLVELLNGSIALDSLPNKGTTFTVKIPLPLAENAPATSSVPTFIPSTRQISVLVLDNDEVLLAMTRDMFARYNIPCDTCRNVCELMEMIRIKNYDLLLTDLKMPEINGYDVLELLRSSHVGNSRTIPVIVATASGSCRTEDLLAVGFSAHLSKPFSSSELLETAEKCIKAAGWDERIDFSPLLLYELNKGEMLDKLVRETKKDMKKLAETEWRNNRKILDEQVHHLRSSWAIIHADEPLRELYNLLHETSPVCTIERLEQAVKAVLSKGETIIRLALKIRESYAEDNSN